MTNPLKGEGGLKALGKTWTLKLPFAEAQRLKSELGVDLINDGASMADLDKFDGVLLAMLRKAHPDATPEVALEILDEVGMKPVIDAMQPALAAFLGVSVEELKKGGERPQ
ncbi:MAG TPA: hypothetical protein VN018_09240 [Brevundimonas sp.]|nr:hypothetical protein [Brevundimonas sp.]